MFTGTRRAGKTTTIIKYASYWILLGNKDIRNILNLLLQTTLFNLKLVIYSFCCKVGKLE